MKIYTNTFDLSRPSPHRFWVSPYSDFKFGIKLVNAGAEVQNDFTVAAGTTELTPDEDKIDGFTIFTAKSADTGFVEYTIDVADIVQKFKLVQIITDSTVFEVGGEGGDVPADVATQTWVNSQISDFITDDALNGYATEDYVSSQISDFITDDALTACVPLTGNVNMTGSLSVSNEFNGVELDSSNGVTVWDTDEGKQKIVSLDYDGLYVKGYNDVTANEIEYPTKSGTMVVDADLTAYYTKSETSSATELADAFAGASGGGISIREALDNGICLPQTIFENVDGSLSSLDIAGTVDFTEGRVGTGASILSNAVRVNIGTNISAFGGRTFGWTDNLTSLVIPESVKTANVNEMFSSSKLDNISATVRFPDSLTAFGNGNPFWNASHLTIDFGDTRKTIPTIGGIASLNNGGVVILVPDALYDKWITTSPWNDTSTSASKVRPRSSRNAAQKIGKSKTGQAPIVNTVHSVYETDWATLSATADANTFYVVLPDPA